MRKFIMEFIRKMLALFNGFYVHVDTDDGYTSTAIIKKKLTRNIPGYYYTLL